MKSCTLLCTLLALTAAAFAQDAEAPADDNLSFQEIQELLDRFSDTTMKSIEQQLRKKVDDYEEALENTQTEATITGNNELPPTHRLTFSISDVSAPTSVLVTEGNFTLNADRSTTENRSQESAQQEYSLQCNGGLELGGPDRVLVSFQGIARLETLENESDGSKQESASISFSGSAWFTVGEELEIARNDDLSVILKVETTDPPTQAEAPDAP